ncbi:MAG: hypothetical protein CXZ00_02415, partial [Acidobacteria bacterium]
RGSGASSATLQSPAPPQIPVPSLTLLAHFYSALLAYFYSALDNPFDSSLFSLGSDIWEPIFETNLSLSVRSCAFLLLLGSQNPSGRPFNLVSKTFEVVHRAADQEQLDSGTWFILRDHLPTLGYWSDWDICERLRRLLVDKYVAFGWPVSSLLLTLQNPVTLDRTLRYIATERHLRAFGRQLISEANAGCLPLTDTQTGVLSKYEWRFRG